MAQDGITRRTTFAGFAGSMIRFPAREEDGGGGTPVRNSTYTRIAALRAAPVDNRSYIFAPDSGDTSGYGKGIYFFSEGDFSAPALAGELLSGQLVKLDTISLSQGALVRQDADSLSFRNNGRGAVRRSVDGKLQDTLSVRDFGAIGDGTLHTIAEWIVPGRLGRYASLAAIRQDYPHALSAEDSIDRVAIQAALNAAGAFAIEDTELPGYAYTIKGGDTVHLPRGAYILGRHGGIEIPQNVSLIGAGKHSAVLQSDFNGQILRNRATATGPGTYDRGGMAFVGFGIIGNRQMQAQDGISFLRWTQGLMLDVHVSKCGRDAFVMLQCGVNKIINATAAYSGRYGLYIGKGFDDWARAANDLPSNANCFDNFRAMQTGGPGICIGPGTNGNTWNDALLEYCGSAQGNNKGYQLHSATDGYTANVFNRLWTEGHCEAHVYATNTGGAELEINGWRHFGDGEDGKVDRALINNASHVIIRNASSPRKSYRRINGSVAPFRLIDKAAGLIEVYDSRGALVDGIDMVEDASGSTTGFHNGLRQRNPDVQYGPVRHFTDAHAPAADEWYTDTARDYAFLRITPYKRGLAFGDGSAEPALVLKKLATHTLGLDAEGGPQAFRAGFFAHEPMTVAQLASATLPALLGCRGFVTDSRVPFATGAGSIVAGGGDNRVPVYHDGNHWRIG
ncbi:MAG: hypothetical protein PGN08_04655 [Sphingomonas taxi]